MVKRSGTLILLALVVVLALPAYWLLFSTLMAHDDEGYVLISLQNYASHGALYTRVFSQYGPFFYFFHDAAHRLLGYEFTNTGARFVTLVCWLVAGFACARLVWRQTQNHIFSAATLAGTFVYLQLMVSEPIHPGGLIAAMVALTVSVGAELIERRAIGGLAIVAAVTGSALLLIKINVGIFFILSCSAWFLVHLRPAMHARLGTSAMAFVFCILPLGLMISELHEPWARQFAALSMVASLTMLMAGWTIREPITQWKFAGFGMMGAVLLIAVVSAGVVFRGTSLPTIFENVVLNPLRQPGIYHFAPDWKPASLPAAILSAVVAALYRAGTRKWLQDIILAVRLLGACVLGLAACHWFPFSFHSSVMSYLVPWAWIMIPSLARNEPGPSANIKLWIGLVLVLQYLHAYPVAGSQIAWGTFLAIPLVALGLQDAWLYLNIRTPIPVVREILFFAAVLPFIAVAQLSIRGWHQYQESTPLELSGAENIRPPREFSSALRMLTANAKVHGDMVFSLPGMFSFNQWSSLPPPTLNNTTHWFTLLNGEQQREIADALTRDPKPVVIVHQGMLKFLSDAHFPVNSLLSDFLNINFSRAFRVDDFEFWVRRGRKIVPVNTAEFLHPPTPAAGMPIDQLQLVVAVSSPEQIAKVELVTLADSPTVIARWDQDNAQLSYHAFSVTDDVVSVSSHVDRPQPQPLLIRLDIGLRHPVVYDPGHSIVLVKNSTGKTIAEARFVE